MGTLFAVVVAGAIFAVLIAYWEQKCGEPPIDAEARIEHLKPWAMRLLELQIVICLLLTFFFLLYFITNIREGWRTFMESRGVSGWESLALQGFWKANFQKLCVDKSAVTPFIGFMCSLVALMRSVWLSLMLRGKRAVVDQYFPLFKGYQNYLVQLGLVGTLVGFVFVGGRMGVKGGQGTMSGDVVVATGRILLDAFSTALISTLAGVSSAFFVGPVVVRVNHLVLRLGADRLEPTMLSEVEEVDVLNTCVRELQNSLDCCRKEVDGFAKNLSGPSDGLLVLFTELNSLTEGLRIFPAGIDERLAEVVGGLQTLEDVVNETTRQVVDLANQISGDVNALPEKINEMGKLREIAEKIPAANEFPRNASVQDIGNQVQMVHALLGCNKDDGTTVAGVLGTVRSSVEDLKNALESSVLKYGESIGNDVGALKVSTQELEAIVKKIDDLVQRGGSLWDVMRMVMQKRED